VGDGLGLPSKSGKALHRREETNSGVDKDGVVCVDAGNVLRETRRERRHEDMKWKEEEGR